MNSIHLHLLAVRPKLMFTWFQSLSPQFCCEQKMLHGQGPSACSTDSVPITVTTNLNEKHHIKQGNAVNNKNLKSSIIHKSKPKSTQSQKSCVESQNPFQQRFFIS
ncbi:hypothetical protein AMECASPLE_039430 [Ameca splendens]|uniref:Uncharacterized protein n=1 Tax=Ameca splendens TaxID=208324 RepID=A0ABV0XLK3_9TELE